VDAVVRGMAIYLVLLVLFRLVGKRALAQITTFDFVLLLIISEATQQALLGEDFSVINAALVIATLIGTDRLFDYVSWRFPLFERLTDSTPVILVEDGRVLDDVLAKEHVSKDQILESARKTQGLERMDQIKWAIQETSGGISIVPKENAAPNA
jgi:uncharacterized membrane protein YcaP (DUF421 family)